VDLEVLNLMSSEAILTPIPRQCMTEALLMTVLIKPAVFDLPELGTGSAGGAETRPRNIALMYIIKHD